MSATERDTLVHAHRRALKLMTDARAEAEDRLIEAQQEAMELLFRQQDAAARILLEETETAEEHEEVEEQKTVGRSPASRQGSRDVREREAAFLKERQRLAAEKLRAAQAEAADKLNREMERVYADILLVAQEDAAALLLEARNEINRERQSE